MSLPDPKPGLVIRYSFLWSHEKAAGADAGAKDRPAAIIVAARREESGEIRTIVAPITHRPPEEANNSLEVPIAVCPALGLDGDRTWLRLDDSIVSPGLVTTCVWFRAGRANTPAACCPRPSMRRRAGAFLRCRKRAA